MAGACDIRIAGRSARFGAGFIKIGLSGDWGTTWSLTQLVGTAKARELMLTGDMIDADEALRIGLVNKVVDDAELLTTTMARTTGKTPLSPPRIARSGKTDPPADW